MTRVYLDHAATTPVRPVVMQAMVGALETFGNPSSIHREGQAARHLLDSARRSVAGLLDVRAEQVVFTSGGTEANNLALRGVNGPVLVSAVEHDSALHTAQALGGAVIPVDANGCIKLDALETELKRGKVALVSVMHANNETGVIQPVAEVAALAHTYGALCHSDAVQTAGHLPFTMAELGVDMLTLSAHKLGGSKGVGALVVKSEIQDKLTAQLTGGAQERNRRAGTENLPGIVGFGVAAQVAQTEAAGDMYITLNQLLHTGLKSLPVQVVAPATAKVPHIVQIRTPGRKGEDMVIALDLAGVAVSQGSACSSGRVQTSHVLKAMGLTDAEAAEGLRISLGWATTEADITAFGKALGRILA